VGLASANLDTQLADLPTVAEFEARTLIAADYGTAANQTTIAGYLDTEVAAILAAVDTEVSAIKAKTDQLTFTVANQVDSNALSGGGSGLDAAGVRAAIGLDSANLDTQLADLPTVAEFEARTLLAAAYGTAANQSTIIGYIDTEVSAIKAKTDNLPASPAATSDIPSAATVASQVRTELATELARVDVAISTRLATAGYTAPLDAAGVRSAVGLASANLDTQFGDLPTAAENATAVSSINIDGQTLQAALRIIGAIVAGEVSGAGTVTEVFVGLDGTTTRATMTVDASGNRSVAVYS
jgi:hypothetical protein